MGRFFRGICTRLCQQFQRNGIDSFGCDHAFVAARKGLGHRDPAIDGRNSDGCFLHHERHTLRRTLPAAGSGGSEPPGNRQKRTRVLAASCEPACRCTPARGWSRTCASRKARAIPANASRWPCHRDIRFWPGCDDLFGPARGRTCSKSWWRLPSDSRLEISSAAEPIDDGKPINRQPLQGQKRNEDHDGQVGERVSGAR